MEKQESRKGWGGEEGGRKRWLYTFTSVCMSGWSPVSGLWLVTFEVWWIRTLNITILLSFFLFTPQVFARVPIKFDIFRVSELISFPRSQHRQLS